MPVIDQAWGSLGCPQPGEVAGVWPWGISRNSAGELTIGQCSVPELVSQYGNSFRCLDLDDLVSRATVNSFAWAEEFWDGYGFAGVDIYLPVGLCPFPEALLALSDLGFLFRISSAEELDLLESLDISLANVAFELGEFNCSAADRYISAGGTSLVLCTTRANDSLDNLVSGANTDIQILWRVSAADLEIFGTDTDEFMNTVSFLSSCSSLSFAGLEIDYSDFSEDFSKVKDLLVELLKLRHNCLDNDLDFPMVGISLNGKIQKYAGNQIIAEPVYFARELANLLRQACETMGDKVPRFSVGMGPWLVSPSIFSVCEVTQRISKPRETEKIHEELTVSSSSVFPGFWSIPDTGFVYRGVVLANRVSPERIIAFKCVGLAAFEDYYLLAPEDVSTGDLLVFPLGDFIQADLPAKSFVDLVLWQEKVEMRQYVPETT